MRAPQRHWGCSRATTHSHHETWDRLRSLDLASLLGSQIMITGIRPYRHFCLKASKKRQSAWQAPRDAERTAYHRDRPPSAITLAGLCPAIHPADEDAPNPCRERFRRYSRHMEGSPRRWRGQTPRPPQPAAPAQRARQDKQDRWSRCQVERKGRDHEQSDRVRRRHRAVLQTRKVFKIAFAVPGGQCVEVKAGVGRGSSSNGPPPVARPDRALW